MPTLLRVFDHFETAQRAWDLLVAAGLDTADIELRPPEDDGGPVQGNFMVDLEELPTPPVDDPVRQSEQSELRTPVQRGTYLLCVSVRDDEQGQAVARLLQPLGAGDRKLDKHNTGPPSIYSS